jgi:uncharacterized integral membrane protein (TIGR00697 family)
MNELLFLGHGLTIIFFLFLALSMGKDTICAFISVSWLLANFFVTKQVFLFGFECTASDVYVIGAMIGTSILQEFFGKKEALKSMWTSFFILALFVTMTLCHLAYTPSPSDSMHSSFLKLLEPMPRLALVSFLTSLFVTRLDIALFGFLQRFSKIPFALRSFLSTSSVLLIDTLLFSILGLWGIASSLLDIFIISYTIKLIITCSMSPFLSCAKYIFSHKHSLEKTI